MARRRITHRYRVNIEIEVKDADGKLFNESFHIGFWGDLPMASQVIVGLDVRGLAFHYRCRAGYTPTGRAVTVIAKCEFDAENNFISHESVVRSMFEYGVSNDYTKEYEVGGV